MNLESQVCGVEYAKNLTSLRVKMPSYFIWVKYKNSFKVEVRPRQDFLEKFSLSGPEVKIFPAYTVAELFELVFALSNIVWKICKVKNNWMIYSSKDEPGLMAPPGFPVFSAFTVANCLAELLIYLVKA